MKKSSDFELHSSSRKGEKMCKKARMSWWKVKTMLVCFFHHKWIVHDEFIAQGQTAYQQCYVEVLKSLRESVRRKKPGFWPDKWILHHDKVPANDVLRFHEFLAKNSITKMDHTPHPSAIFGSFQN
jgi:hypothetical protein